MTPGEQTRDFLFISDFVKAIIAALNRPIHGIYNAGTGIGRKMSILRILAQRLTGTDGL